MALVVGDADPGAVRRQFGVRSSFPPLKDCARILEGNDWNELELHQVAPVGDPLL